MPDAPAPTSDVAAHVGSGLTKKLGPLPIWGWVLVGGGVIVVGYLAYNAYQNAQGNTSSTPSLGDLSSLLGGSGTPAGTLATTPTTTTTTPLTNSAWLQPLIAQVASATGYSQSEVSLYLDEYLAGNQPVGVPGGTNAFQSIVNSALSLGGAPPQAPPTANLNTNYFTSNQAYLDTLLTFLPSGTSQSVINELQNLFSGTTSTISADAANALAAAQSVVGQGPNPVTFSVIPSPVTLAQVQALLATNPAAGQTNTLSALNAWEAAVRANVPSLANASNNDLTYIWNQIQTTLSTNGGANYFSGAAGAQNQVNLINSVLSQLGNLPAPTSILYYNGTTTLGSTPLGGGTIIIPGKTTINTAPARA